MSLTDQPGSSSLVHQDYWWHRARADLLHDPRFRDAEVLRMPAGSNPSWLTATQLAAVLERAGLPVLGPWAPLLPTDSAGARSPGC